MPSSSVTSRLVTRLRAVLSPGGERSDGQLLADFIQQHDETAFAVLVKRHGPMVLGVCRRVVHDWHLAEDAFQAVFLVLARRASAVRPREQVGNWLYGVAYRTACKARADLARRRSREKQVDPMPHPEVRAQDVWSDLQPLLDAEVARLPDKLRLPLVLCDLEGRPQRTAARQLDLPVTTLVNRLTAARRLLAERLTAKGVTLSGGALATVLATNAASAAVPAALAASAIKSATAAACGLALVGIVPTHVLQLSEGVIRMMLLAKIKVALSVTVALALLAGGFGVATLPASWAENDEAKPAANPQPVRNQPGPKLNEPEFLRRVSLDLRGIVPTELEMRYFLADVDAKKRTRVVEWMLKDVNEGRHQAMFTPQAHDVVNWVGPMNDALWVTDADVKNSSYAEVFQNLASSTEAASLFLGRTNVLNEVLISHDDRPVLVTVPEPYRTLKFNTSSYELLNAATKAQLRYSAYRYVKAVDTSDEGFLHRAIQDARGVAPSTIELEYFKADKDPKKREKLLDLLLKDPAVAKKVGADWKANMLQPAHGYYTLTATPTTRLYYSLARNKLHAPNRLDTLIGQLLDGKRTDEQVLEGLSLALLGRLPTESERKLVLAQVGKQQDKPAAWREVLTTLAATGEAKKHADAVKQQGTAK